MTRDEAEKIRKGDVLTIRVIAHERMGVDRWFFDNKPGSELASRGYAFHEDILSRTPAPREIKVGDTVISINQRRRILNVRAIDGIVVWLRTDSGNYVNEYLSALRHADATEGHAHD